MVAKFLGEGREIGDWGLEARPEHRRRNEGRKTGDTGERMVVVEGSWRDDKWRLQAVWLDGQRREVVGQGRQGQEADGTTLVMAELAGGTRVELRVDVTGGTWRAGSAWERGRTA